MARAAINVAWALRGARAAASSQARLDQLRSDYDPDGLFAAAA